MFQFMFFQGDNPGLLNQMRLYARKAWGDCHEAKLDSFHVFRSSNQAGHFEVTENHAVALAGYVIYDHLGHRFEGPANVADAHLKRLVGHFLNTSFPWPLGSEWGGSFAAIVYDAARGRLALCNDAIGWQPLYYASSEGGFIGGTNIYILGKILQTQVDPAGLLERLYWPHANYGRRTLLKGVSRLLPGEFVWLDLQGRVLERTFDDSFYQGIIKGDVREIAGEVWQVLRKEVQDAVGFRDQIHIGLSGGWDSRLVLAAIAEMGEKITAWTYGGDDYEAKMAQRAAQAAGARFELCPLAGNNFPTYDAMCEIVRRVERVDYSAWFTVLERLGKCNDALFLLGDHTESIVGRNILRYASREAKLNWRFFIGRGLEFTPTTYPRFAAWRENKVNTLLTGILEKADLIAEPLREEMNLADLSEQVRFDLHESISRIEGHMPLYVELLDELFVWFHYNRYMVIGQNRHVGYDTEAISPNLSFRFLRLSSRVHPEFRVTRRLMDMLGRLPGMEAFGKIPAANIPWFGANYPTAFLNAVWTWRSKTDQYLMKRILRTKNLSGRQRVVKANDYLREYQLPTTLPRIQSWYSGDWVKAEPFLGLAEKRKKMEDWPSFGLDLVAPGNVSVLLDLIFKE